MANRSDDPLILYFYGEHEAPGEIERALASDPELARRYAALEREISALDRLAPAEPRAGLPGRMWARVAPELAPARRAPWLRWAMASAGVLIVALSAFVAGRGFRTPPTEDTVAETIRALPAEARDRVLVAALADHLDSSQRLLLEVANGTPSLDEERAWAEALLSGNRLYRKAAERAGQRRVAAVLAELEPVLVQLAEAPDSFDPRVSQARILREDLLFKVRVTRNNLKGLS